MLKVSNTTEVVLGVTYNTRSHFRRELPMRLQPQFCFIPVYLHCLWFLTAYWHVPQESVLLSGPPIIKITFTLCLQKHL